MQSGNLRHADFVSHRLGEKHAGIRWLAATVSHLVEVAGAVILKKLIRVRLQKSEKDPD